MECLFQALVLNVKLYLGSFKTTQIILPFLLKAIPPPVPLVPFPGLYKNLSLHFVVVSDLSKSAMKISSRSF